MQIPPIEDFRRQSGPVHGPPWTADPAGSSVSLVLPDGGDEDGDGEWRPHRASHALACAIAGELDALSAQAAESLRGMVDPASRRVAGAPSLVSVRCDAREGRVTLEMTFDADAYALWTVTFAVRDGSPQRWPVAMGVRAW